MRSGVFGGFRQSISNDRSESMEFKGAPQQMSFSGNGIQSTGINSPGTQGNKLVSNEKLNKVALQAFESSPKTKGGSKYELPTAAEDSPEIKTNYYGDANLGIEYGDDDQELQMRDLELDDGGIDQDFDFIEDDIAMFMTEI